METFEKFVKSDAFFPVLLALLIILFVSLIAIILLNRKSSKQMISKQEEKTELDKIVNDNVSNVTNNLMEEEKSLDSIQETIVNQEELTNNLMSLDETIDETKVDNIDPFGDNNFNVIEENAENEIKDEFIIANPEENIQEHEKTLDEEIEEYINNFFETKVKSR